MKQYFVDTGLPKGLGIEPVEANTLDEAIDKVKWEYANAGVVKLIAITYKKVNEKSYIIDTNY